jgi:hypothetical protein
MTEKPPIKFPAHPDDFGYTEKGYIEWLIKNNPHIAPWDFVAKSTGKLKEQFKWRGMPPIKKD